MCYKITKLMMCLIGVILLIGSPSIITADSLHNQATIIVDGGGQVAIEEALDQVQPGDTILVKSGNYDNGDPLEPLIISVTGTAEAPITILGENRPILGTVSIASSDQVVLEGFEISNQASDRFFLGLEIKHTNNVVVRNMLIHHLTATAVSMGGDTSNVLIEDSKIYEITPYRNETDALCFITDTAEFITIRNNECFGFIGDGYQARQPDDTRLYDRRLTIIEGNKIYNTKGPCSENALDIKAEAGRVIVRNNEFFGFQEMQQDQCAIHASGCGACQVINLQNGGTGDAVIENNKIYDSDNVLYNAGMNITMQNNIIHDISGYVIYDTTTSTKLFHNTVANVGRILHQNSTMPHEVVNNLFHEAGTAVDGFDHNGWFETDQQQPGPSDVTGSDPHLNVDFSLKASSPVIDKATDLGIDTDFTNIPGMRPHGAAPDIGAFEFTSDSSEPTPEPTDEPTGEPTPEPTDEPTPEPTDEPTPEPTNEPAPASMVLALGGPANVDPGETFAMDVEAHNVTGDGIYGTQLEVNYNPELISVSNLQVNADLSFVLRSTIDETNGKIMLVASREGRVPGLTGDITLLTFDVTAGDTTATTDLTFENQKISDAQAQSVETSTEDHTVSIGDVTPEPTDEPTPEPTDEPTPEPTDEPTDEPTPEPTDEPTPEPTDEPTPEPTNEPTPEPTDEPTPEPTDEPTPEPTDQPTPEPTDEPTPEPGNVMVHGQVILAGRSGNDWSGAVLTVEYEGQVGDQETATTDTGGNFMVENVSSDVQSSFTANAQGYLLAVCTGPSLGTPDTTLLPVTLISGEIVEDDVVDIADATAIGISFDQSGSDMPADINRDGVVDIFDLVLVSLNFGEQGPQEWLCQ